MKNTTNFILLCLITTLFVILSLFNKADWSQEWYHDLFSNNPYNFQFLWLSVIWLGFLAYWLKASQQYWYGLLESLIVLALCIVYIATVGEKNVIGSIIALVSGVLSMGRAWTNIIEGSEKQWFGHDSLDKFINFSKKWKKRGREREINTRRANLRT